MIELQKYSKIDDEHLLKRVTGKHTDSRLKVVGYVSLALVVSFVGITYQLAHTFFMPADQRALKTFEADTNSESMKAFVNFIAVHGKNYEDHTETARRYSNFKSNYEQVQKSKLHEQHMPFTISADNMFADLSSEEFMQLVGIGAVVPQSIIQNEAAGASIFTVRQESVPIHDKVSAELPQYKNWIEEGVIAAAQDSLIGGTCASSWAFATVATLEAFAAINGGGQSVTPLSVQQLIDCDLANNGCQGGWTYKGFAYTSKYGLMPSSEYAYSGKQGECAYDETKAVGFKNTDAVQERYLSNEKMKEIIAKQPIAAGFVLTDKIQLYKSGVLGEASLQCSDAKKEINHAVAVVGFGKTERSNVESSWCSEYWIVRNSWGSTWGENGTFRLCMDGAGKSKLPYGPCHINRFPVYPTYSGPAASTD